MSYSQSMAPLLIRAFLVLAASALAGCSWRGYFIDRARDAGDIFTATAGGGYGAKARVGPLGTGMFLNWDQAGLRGGHFFFGLDEFEDEPIEYTTIFGHGSGGPDRWPPCANDVFVYEKGAARPKSYSACGTLPLISWVEDGPYHWSARYHYYTQLEAAAGLLATLRLGVNLAEVVDFAVGWSTMDPMGDDVGAQRQSTE